MWSEQTYQLAWWAWKKWRFHRMTSLRVGTIASLLPLFPPTVRYCVFFMLLPRASVFFFETIVSLIPLE